MVDLSPPPFQMILAKLDPRNPVHSCLIVLLYCAKEISVRCVGDSEEMFWVPYRKEVIGKCRKVLKKGRYLFILGELCLYLCFVQM
jgi:hypothetical protein